jgi:signal transduction histidine kinase/ActR/RegA family two-component response regulator
MDEKQFHPLLLRQLKRNGIDISSERLPKNILTLLEHISNTYHESDMGHHTTVQSLEISSQELHELRVKLQKEKDIIQSVMSDGLCIFDQNWKIIDLNKTGAQLLFISPEEAIGKKGNEVFTLYKEGSNSRKKISLNSLEGSLAKKNVYHCERGYLISTKEIIVPITFSINPLPTSDGTFQGAVLLFRDIKELLDKELALKSAVKLAEKSNRAKSIFLSNMSHEIRTPMNGIMGMLQLLMHTSLDEKQKNYVEKCFESATSLLRVLGDILDLSKIEAGKVSFENVVFSFRDEMTPLMNLYHLQSERKEIAFTVEYDDKIPKLLNGDPHRIKQILSNLISNAIKFTPNQGRINVKFDLIKIDEEGAIIQTSVIDTGVGVPEEAQGFIFEMFSQADGSTTRKYGGTGLGLAISKQLVELMGGEIHVKSVEGKGSTFYFILRLSCQKNKISEKSHYTLEYVSSITPKFHASILLVEDNILNQLVTRDMLKALGCNVTVVSSGQDAIDILMKQKFDLIFMDCHMPGLNGYVTTQKIRELEKVPGSSLNLTQSKNIIVALTANALKGSQEECLESGMNDWLTKPVHLAQLQEIMAKYIPLTKERNG